MIPPLLVGSLDQSFKLFEFATQTITCLARKLGIIGEFYDGQHEIYLFKYHVSVGVYGGDNIHSDRFGGWGSEEKGRSEMLAVLAESLCICVCRGCSHLDMFWGLRLHNKN